MLLAAGSTLIPLAGAAEIDEDTVALIGGNNDFALSLYAQIKGGDGNLFFSPVSVSTALAMTYGGARGQTASQMADVLRFDLPPDRLHAAFGTLQKDWLGERDDRPYQLSVANALWVQQGMTLLETFLELARANYGAGPNEVDFRTAAEHARQTINGWIERQTEGRIKDLLKPGVVDAATRLVLTNAIYFKGTWKYQFDAAKSAEAPFTVGPGKQVEVPMMRQKGQFRIGGAGGVQLLELPYEGGDLSMVVLLPREVDGLNELEASLTAERIDRWLETMREREVMVFLPRFELTAEFELAEVLAAMGMTDAFGSAADFSGIDGTRTLFISNVVHKAFVSVDEQGTEAAAATGVVMKRTAMPPTFRADHPFVFVIRHNQTGSLLFVGRVVNPVG